MTAYAAIADSDIDPESPGTTTLFTRLRDNPLAQAEGTSPAPSIQTAALVAGERMTTGNVNGEIAGSSVGAVGTCALLGHATLGTDITAGSTYAGSALRYWGYFGSADGTVVAGTGALGATPAGTWRAMGTVDVHPSYYAGTLFLRIS